MFDGVECKFFRVVYYLVGKISNYVGSVMIEVCIENFDNRKKG